MLRKGVAKEMVLNAKNKTNDDMISFFIF
jgi:hypothetical protein